MKKVIKTIGTKLLAFFLLPVIAYGVFAILRPRAFLNPGVPVTILNQSLSNIVLAWGMSFSMMIGNMDFSCVAERILGAILGISLCNVMGPIGLVIGVLAIALIVGAAKALLAIAMDIKNRVVTIAYTLVLGSLGYFVTSGDTSVISVDMGLFRSKWFCIALFTAFGVIVYFLNQYSMFGAQCRALAGNESLALSSGINKKKVESIATMVCSLYIAASALLTVARGGGATPQSGLTSMSAVFSAMSGVFIANALAKYLPQPIGIIVGNYTMSLIIYGLVACNLPTQLTTTVNGGFLLVILLFMEVKDRIDAEKIRKAAVQRNLAC